MSAFSSYIVKTSLYKKGVVWLKSVHFLNSEISLYLIVVIFLKKLKSNEISMKAGAVAFHLTLSIFPAIIFLFTLAPFLPIEDVQGQIFGLMEEVSPSSIYGTALETLHDILSKPRGQLLSFGFMMAAFMATNGMLALIRAFNSCYHKSERRSFLKTRVIALFLTFILALILFLAVFMIVAGNLILNTLVDLELLDKNYIYYLIDIMRYVVMCLILFITISVIYYLAPSVPRRWSFFSVGSVIATLLIVLFSLAFSFYMDHFATYNKLYGSIGAMIGIMLWLLAISNVLLIGFEINSTLDVAKDRLKKLEQRLENEILGTTARRDHDDTRDHKDDGNSHAASGWG